MCASPSNLPIDCTLKLTRFRKFYCVRTPPQKIKDAAEPANMVDEERAWESFFSARRTGFFGVLFLGAQEAVCAVAIEPPPPIPRSCTRSFDFLMPVRALSSHSLFAAPGPARCLPAARAQKGAVLHHAERVPHARGRRRPRLRRPGRLESRRLHVLSSASALLWGVGSGVPACPPCVAGGARAATCTAGVAGVFTAAAWPPS